MAFRPAAVAFDMFQTLFSLEPLRAALVGIGLPPSALELWFARTLRDGFALAATGDYHPFQMVAIATLRGLALEAGVEAPPQSLADVLSLTQELPAQPEACSAMRLLQDAGIKTFALTNGSETGARALLARAGLMELTDDVVSIDHVNAWKPRPEPYRRVVELAGLDACRVALVAAHAWDCHGAHRAGLTTGWISRTEKIFSPAFGRPDAEGEHVLEVCEALLRLPNHAS